MTTHTLSTLIFGTENPEASAPVVFAPGLNDITLTRHQLEQASQQLADLILSKSKAHESGFSINGQPIVALALPNGVGFVCTFLGLVSRGAVAAPLNPAYTVPEYEVGANLRRMISVWSDDVDSERSSTSVIQKRAC
jgi:acyl-CoA synthetase (AMP-forming)/AMP-acid ligase II